MNAISNNPISSYVGRLLRASALVLASVVAAGCVATTAPADANDPSSPQAATALAHEESKVLDEGHAPLPEVASDAPSTGAAGASQAHDHSAHDQDAHDHHAHQKAEKPAKVYTCPMHPEVLQGEPGRCPKCSMALELTEPEAENKE